MRVAWILYGDLDQRTGGTIYDAEVIDGLRRAGDDVRVIGLRQGASVLGQARRLVRQLAMLDADVVVGDELCFRELAIAFRFIESRRVLLVHHWTAWEPELGRFERAIAHARESAALSAADIVVTTSETTRARLPRPGARVVRPGSDRLGARVGAGGGGLVFLGSVTARKRVLPLVRAFAAGAAGRLAIIGSTTRDPAYVTRVREAVEGAGVADRVVLRGEVSDDDVAQALCDADALVMPSSLEGYGIAAAEALWAGVPVIAARTPGLEEALGPFGDASILVNDDDALIAALRAITHDAALRSSLASAARGARARLPTWRDCATAFRDALTT